MSDADTLIREARQLAGDKTYMGYEGDIAWFLDDLRDHGTGSKSEQDYFDFLVRCAASIDGLADALERLQGDLAAAEQVIEAARAVVILEYDPNADPGSNETMASRARNFRHYLATWDARRQK